MKNSFKQGGDEQDGAKDLLKMEEEILQNHNYSHEKIKERLLEAEEELGVAGIIKAVYS